MADVIPQPDALLSSTGRPAAEPLTTDHPIDSMAVDRSGYYGVSAFVVLPDAAGWPARYRIVVAPVVEDATGQVIGIMEPAPVTVEWIREQGWILALEELFGRLNALILDDTVMQERIRRDILASELDWEAATEAEKASLSAAFEETVGSYARAAGELAEELGQDVAAAARRAAKEAKHAFDSAVVWGIGLALGGVAFTWALRTLTLTQAPPPRRRVRR